MNPTLLWFRLDLRLADHPALQAARERGGAVIPVFIWSPAEENPWKPGEASRWWLHHSLQALDSALHKAGSRLILRKGDSLSVLRALARETGADAVYWHRRYEPAAITRDTEIKSALLRSGIEGKSFNAALLHEPWEIKNQSGKPFQVFTAFWKHCLKKDEPAPPLPAPSTIPTPCTWPESTPLKAFGLEPKVDWAGGMRAAWTPGETGARLQLRHFLRQTFSGYADTRNLPGIEGTSRLSPHLHFGEIGPRQVWQALRTYAEKEGNKTWRQSPFAAEIGWREFAHHLLYHYPRTPEKPLRPAFATFPWKKNPTLLRAWQKGRTGYPIVDAGLRELWATGWMHNRVRMIAASFLVKDLLISWQDGSRWFWNTLVDADLAQNTLGWQWTAGCGADAAPYFRIFNPVSQGEKFDPEGLYVRRWVPEIAGLPNKWIHQPWETPQEILLKADVRLGKTYPKPIVAHGIARQIALQSFAKIRNSVQ
jgi:deoxyribodipyrimidine photo-lyase